MNIRWTKARYDGHLTKECHLCGQRVNLSPIDITEDITPPVGNGPSTLGIAFGDFLILITAQRAMGPPLQSVSPIIHHIGNIQISERDMATCVEDKKIIS